MDTVNADYLPEEPICSTIEYVEATDGPSQSDSPVSVMEIVEESQWTCCYQATYRTVRDQPDCVVGRTDGRWHCQGRLCVTPSFKHKKIHGQKVLLFIV